VEALKVSLPEEELKKKIADVHAIGIRWVSYMHLKQTIYDYTRRSNTELTEGVFQAAKRLLCVGCFCIGYNQVDLIAAQKQGVSIPQSFFWCGLLSGRVHVVAILRARVVSHNPLFVGACFQLAFL